MATKKTNKQPSNAPSSKNGDELNLPDLAAPPETDDPEAMATYFVEMLEALGEGNAEMRRVRDVLVACIESFHDNPDKEEAKEIFLARLAGVEEGVAFLLLGNVKRLRDTLVKDSRKLGTGSKVGKAARVGADALTLLADGLQMLLDAAVASDPEMRAEAQVAMKQAHAKMLELEAATK